MVDPLTIITAIIGIGAAILQTIKYIEDWPESKLRAQLANMLTRFKQVYEPRLQGVSSCE
jgi:hypothetical protein